MSGITVAIKIADTDGFDAFVARYNAERPHEALEMRVAADDYRRSPRPYRGLTELEYPFHDWTTIVMTLSGQAIAS